MLCEDRKLLSSTNDQNQSDTDTDFFMLPTELVPVATQFFKSNEAMASAPVYRPDPDSEFDDIYGPLQAVPHLDVWENYHPSGSHGSTFNSRTLVDLTELDQDWFLVTLRTLSVTQHLNLSGDGGGGMGGGGTGGGGGSGGPKYQFRQTEYSFSAVIADAQTAALIEQSQSIDLSQFDSFVSVSTYHSFLYEWTAGSTTKDYAVTFYYDGQLDFEWQYVSSETTEQGITKVQTPSVSGTLEQTLHFIQAGLKSVDWDGQFLTTYTFSGSGSGSRLIASDNTVTFIKSSGDWQNPGAHQDDYQHTVVIKTDHYIESESYTLTIGGGGTRWGYMLTDLYGRTGGPNFSVTGSRSVIDSPTISIFHRSRTTQTEGEPGGGGSSDPSTTVTTMALDALISPRSTVLSTFSSSLQSNWSAEGVLTETTTWSTTTSADWRGSTAQGLSDLEVKSFSPGSVALLHWFEEYDDAWGGVRQDLIEGELTRVSYVDSSTPPVTAGTVTVGSSWTELNVLPDRVLAVALGMVKLEHSTRFDEPPDPEGYGGAPFDPGELGPGWQGGYDHFRNPPPGGWQPGDSDPPELQAIDGQMGDGNRLSMHYQQTVIHTNDSLAGQGWSTATYYLHPDESATVVKSSSESFDQIIDNAFSSTDRLMIIEADAGDDRGLFYFESSAVSGANEGSSSMTRIGQWTSELTKVPESGSSGNGGSGSSLPDYELEISGSSSANSVGQITRADQTIEWGSFVHHGRFYEHELNRVINYVTRRIELGGHSQWDQTHDVVIDSEGVVTETMTGDGYEHVDVELDRMRSLTSTTYANGAGDMSVLIQYDVEEGSDGRGRINYNPPPGGGSGGSGGSGGGGSGGSGSSGGPQMNGSGEGHMSMHMNSRFGELSSGWAHTAYVTNLLITHTPLEEETSSSGGGGDGGSGGGGGGDGGSGSGGDTGTSSSIPLYETTMSGTIDTHATSSFSSAVDDAMAQLFGVSSGRGEHGASHFDFHNQFEISLDELISEAARSSSVQQRITYHPDGSTDVNFDGARHRSRTWSNKYTLPVDNRWLDEDGTFHQEKGKLRFEGAYQSSMLRQLDDLTIKYFPAPDDDPETPEDESLNVPEPMFSGSAITQFHNQKAETLKTTEDLVHQSFRLVQEGDAANYQSEPSFFAQSYSRDVLRYELRDQGNLRTTWTQDFLEDDVRELRMELESIGQGNRSEWDVHANGRAWDYSLHYTPDPYSSGGRYQLYEQNNDYVSTNVGHALVTGGGELVLRRLPDLSESAPGPYRYEADGQLEWITEAAGDAAASGSGQAMRREFSVASYVPGSTTGTANPVWMGYGADGQPLEQPGGQTISFDKLHAASFVHQTEDHFDGTLRDVLTLTIEPDTNDPNRVTVVPEVERTISSKIWGSKNNSARRWGHDFSDGGGSPPPWDVTEPDIGDYGSLETPQSDYWGYHPEDYRSHLYRGFRIEPTPQPLNAGSGSFQSGGSSNSEAGIVNIGVSTGIQDGLNSQDPVITLDGDDVVIALAIPVFPKNWTPREPNGHPGIQLSDAYFPGVFFDAHPEALPWAEELQRIDNKIAELEHLLEMAHLSRACYFMGTLSGWLVERGWDRLETTANTYTGFHAVLYINHKTQQVVLAFAGTDDFLDWLTNIMNGSGYLTGQYGEAITLLNRYKDLYKGRLHIVGHSLGGGLASVTSLTHGIPATTFNAAGVHPHSVTYHGVDFDLNAARRLIDAYRVTGDVLSTTQGADKYLLPFSSVFWLIPWVMPDGIGKNFALKGNSINPLTLHGMSEVIAGIERKIGEQRMLRAPLFHKIDPLYMRF